MIKIFFISLAFALCVQESFGDTLKEIKSRGYLICGVSGQTPGFSVQDKKGKWSGLDVDFCRAVAVAILGDPEKVKYIPVNAKDRFMVLRQKEIDILARNTTWTAQRENQEGVAFPAVNFYDDQAIMVPKTMGIQKGADLDHVTLCVISGTITEGNIAAFFKKTGKKYKIVGVLNSQEALEAYAQRRCHVYANDRAVLASQISSLKMPSENDILPESMGDSPLALVVRQESGVFPHLVAWLTRVLIIGDVYKVGQEVFKDPSKNHLIGQISLQWGTSLDHPLLVKDWPFMVLKTVGHYGEIFERNLGKGTVLNLNRGSNRPWTEGGRMYSPPFR
jgi:general L-amino acid transport system substrate-binding protein